MSSDAFDLIVIGSGPAGEKGAAQAAYFGKRVALVEGERDPERLYDSDTILQMDRIPRSLAVVGGGVIGCEYATMFRAMGIEVTLLCGQDRLLPFLDEEISERP